VHGEGDQRRMGHVSGGALGKASEKERGRKKGSFLGDDLRRAKGGETKLRSARALKRKLEPKGRGARKARKPS